MSVRMIPAVLWALGTLLTFPAAANEGDEPIEVIADEEPPPQDEGPPPDDLAPSGNSSPRPASSPVPGASGESQSVKMAPPVVEERPPPPSPEQKKKACQRYKGHHIAHYATIYYVDSDCKRYEFTGEESYTVTKKQVKLQEVDGLTIQALDSGGSYSQDFLKKAGKLADPCKKFDRQYISFDGVDYYWVMNCKIRRFPDWESFRQHYGKVAKPKGRTNSQLHMVSWEELASLKEARSMPSVIDDELREVPETVEVLSIDDACRGLRNQYATYVGSIYFFEPMGVSGCRRRWVDGEEFTRKHGLSPKPIRLKEITSSQAISIPEGEPFVLGKAKKHLGSK